MSIDQEIEFVRNWIMQNKRPAYMTTNKKELRIRCPYCGDSRKNPNTAHLYIQMQPPFQFYCQKCGSKGLFNEKTMRDFELYSSDIAMSIIEMDREYSKNNFSGRISYAKKNKHLENPVVESPTALNNLNYFNSRFQSNYTASFVQEKFKVVLDAPSFFSANNLHIMSNQYDFVNAIGFIVSDNSHVVFRDTSNMQPRRYFNLLLDENNCNAEKIYNIKSSISLMAPSVNLIITEGILDVIGLYNAGIGHEDNTIMAAACGKGFNAVILKYLHLGFLNLNVSIYSDSDVDRKFYENLKRQSPYLKGMQMKLYYNRLGKDYGVPKDQIDLQVSYL